MWSDFVDLKYGYGRLLEFLILVDNLYAMLILLLSRLLADICEVAIDRHDGRGGGMASIGRRATR